MRLVTVASLGTFQKLHRSYGPSRTQNWSSLPLLDSYDNSGDAISPQFRAKITRSADRQQDDHSDPLLLVWQGRLRVACLSSVLCANSNFTFR